MQNITVTVPGVEKLLLNLKPHKAAGPDAILPRTLKDFATEIAPVLTFIFNKSLSSSTIPDDWRTANVHQYSRRENATYHPTTDQSHSPAYAVKSKST